jgi:hypothetical protein
MSTPTSALDPETLAAALDAADRLELGVFSVPVPVGTRPSSPDSTIYMVHATLDHLAAFYATWAQRSGWQFENVLDNDRYKAITFKRDAWTFELRIGTWIHGENTLHFEWPRGTTATLVSGSRGSAEAPALPPVTRARPPVQEARPTAALHTIKHLLADSGLVFAAKDHTVWLIDPHARSAMLLAEMMRGSWEKSVDGLAADDGDVLVLTSVPLTIWRLDPATGERSSVEVALDAFVRAFTCVEHVGYAACDDGRVVAITLATGAVTELARVSGHVYALAGHADTLYVASEKVVHAIDLVSHETREIVTLPQAARGLASDGTALYTLHGGGIGQIDLATGTWSQIAGKPELGAGNLLVRSSEPAPDGIAERAVIDYAQRMSYDSGSLWFTEITPVRDDAGGLRFPEKERVRRLALAERYVMTLDLA